MTEMKEEIRRMKKQMKKNDKKFDNLKEIFLKSIEEIQSQHLKEKEQMKIEFESFKKDVFEKLALMKSDELENIRESSYKCKNCNTILTRELRPDGVSVTCSKCNLACIVGTLKEGNKWILVEALNYPGGWCQHMQQIPQSTPYGEFVKCRICDVVGPCRDATGALASVMTMSEVKAAKEKQNNEQQWAIERNRLHLCEIQEKLNQLDSIVSGNTGNYAACMQNVQARLVNNGNPTSVEEEDDDCDANHEELIETVEAIGESIVEKIDKVAECINQTTENQKENDEEFKSEVREMLKSIERTVEKMTDEKRIIIPPTTAPESKGESEFKKLENVVIENMEKIAKRLDKIEKKEHKCDAIKLKENMDPLVENKITQLIEKMASNLAENEKEKKEAANEMEALTALLNAFGIEIGKTGELQKNEIEAYKKEVEEILKGLEKIRDLSEPSYSCCRCLSFLPNSLREDGVSATCNLCNVPCIVKEHDEGFKWIYIETNNNLFGWCNHYQQVSVDTMPNDLVKCNICHMYGQCKDLNEQWIMAIKNEQPREVLEETMRVNAENSVQAMKEVLGKFEILASLFTLDMARIERYLYDLVMNNKTIDVNVELPTQEKE